MNEPQPLVNEQLLENGRPKKKSIFRKVKRIIIISVLLIVIVGGYFKFYFVFGEGSKAGELNFIVKKGYLFKTNEGRLIQTGYRTNQPGSIQSNEFEFSVVDEKIFNTLISNSGAFMELHYKEYLGRLPWRGMSKYVVDSIISIRKIDPTKQGLPPIVP